MNKINTIGIIGDGRMGHSIFRHLYNYNYKLIWINLTTYKEESEKLIRKLNRFLSKNIISQEEYDQKTSSIIITNRLEKINDCDLIIETVNEDINIKNSLFDDLELNTKPNAIIVSNSSSILPDKYLLSEKHKPSLCGFHFFYPVETNKMVEIIPSSSTSDETINILINFAKAIEKTSFLQSNNNAFAINRFFLEIQSGLFNFCVKNNIPFADADNAVKSNIFPLGVFETMDIIGLRILEYAIGNYIEMQKESSHILPMLDFLKAKMKEGKKGLIDNEGFLKYPLDNFIVDLKYENRICDFLKSLISKTADNYIQKRIFQDLKEVEFIISEYTNSEFVFKK